jgi:hypothetical protein
VSTHVEEEGGVLCGGVNVVIVRELTKRQECVPVVLPFIYKDSNVLFKFLIDTFSLAIGLWMIGGGQQNCDIKEAISFMHEFSHKLGASI